MYDDKRQYKQMWQLSSLSPMCIFVLSVRDVHNEDILNSYKL